MRATLAIGMLLIAGQVFASSVPLAIDYLNRMGAALQKLNYQGTIIYSHGGQVESMQVFHKNGPNGEYERLVHLSGEPREVIRANDVVTCYMPDSQSVVVGKRQFNSHLLAKLSTDFEPFIKNYSFDVKGEGRVAGKLARLIAITPKDKFRYGYKLWIAKDDYLLLRSELLSPSGEVLERFMFAQVDVVDNISEAMLKPAVSGDKYTWHKEKVVPNAQVVNDNGWQVAKLPLGFKLTDITKQQMPNSEMPADHMVISDGLASVSVYIEAFGAESQPFVGASHMGAVNIYGAVVNDYQVTVVGEVPQPTVRMIAESVGIKPGGEGG